MAESLCLPYICAIVRVRSPSALKLTGGQRTSKS